ncbi:hypothetical protein KSD_44650 [Ktedonobacter sp. SOSP1-85]|nr:hypothetical protein KSD_44650 [Ktedonobacter sp. SOSP1-85]
MRQTIVTPPVCPEVSQVPPYIYVHQEQAVSFMAQGKHECTRTCLYTRVLSYACLRIAGKDRIDLVGRGIECLLRGRLAQHRVLQL